MATIEKKPFKVIIVGGGITGLTLAHCLARANIDYVLLESYATCTPDVGASVGLWPHGMRILSQIGCADEIRAVSKLMDSTFAREPSGKPVVEFSLFQQIQAHHGFEFRNLARKQALDVLWEKLPDKSKVHTNKRIASLHETEDGVVVQTTDGQIERGHVVIGCDGSYSRTRELMWESAEQRGLGKIPQTEKDAFRAEYLCLVTKATGVTELEKTSDMHITTVGPGKTLQIVTQPNTTFVLLYQKLEKPVSGNQRPRYTQEEIDAVAATIADAPATDKIRYGEIYEKRVNTSMVNLEEGIFKRWHYGRVAIAGDAAHKTMPNLAFGANSCIEGVATLANALNAAVHAAPDGCPDAAAITKAFEQYQQTHKWRMQLIGIPAYWSARMQAWDGIIMRFVANWIFPYLPKTTLATACAPLVKGSARLDYVPLGEDLKGTVAWVH